MNRRLAPPLLLASLLASAFAVSAQAVTLAASVETGAQAQAASDATADPSAKQQVDRNCLRHTGSRIVARANAPRSTRERKDKLGQRCVAASGRVYSRDDIERTGEIDIADALRKLDPAIH